jgi:transposase
MMLQALVAGETDSERLAGMAQGRMRSRRASLRLALEGSVDAHQRFLLKPQLRHIEFLEQEIEAMSQEIEERMRPFEPLLTRVDAIPGIGRRSAERILAEIGTDMSYWRSDKALASWAKICPSNNESAGKRRSSWIGAGNQSLRGALVEAAHAAARVKDSYFSALYHRLKAKRGAKRALIAVAHAILVTIYHLLKDGTYYQDLGVDHFERHDREVLVRRSVRRLERFGYHVTLSPAA